MDEMLKAIKDIPEEGIRAGVDRVIPDHRLATEYPDCWEPDPVRGSWRGAGPDPFAGANGKSATRSRAKSTTPPRYDEATELAVRNRVIAEMEADDRAAAHARHGRREPEFWSRTRRFIDRLEPSRLDAAERRQQRVFDDAAALVADADAAPIRRELDGYDELWGGAGRTPWTSLSP